MQHYFNDILIYREFIIMAFPSFKNSGQAFTTRFLNCGLSLHLKELRQTVQSLTQKINIDLFAY